ncbi:MAG: STAS domain-containing protein [Magnetococcales bacterium]|nr:STAS domain-containing protein [Magnetococcales bacterium]MBF0439385.1 STAS domain-containing protein [Magnetococcales bacterium]
MEIIINKNENTVTIVFDSTFTYNNKKDFTRAWEDKQDETKYILDFANTKKIDSAGIGMLLLLREKACANSNTNQLKMINVNNDIKNILNIIKFYGSFYPNKESSKG